ncbi:T9SS type A sorting domain-containing protein [Flavobacterium sp.]|uniref:T9SS type A sorting domain-containing protein n=1 Tax=Flavobacterium sp. TaxID=239 RepID=UPI003263B164
MKKYLQLLLLFTCFWGYSQTQATVTEKPINGARTVTFVNPSPIEVDGTPVITPETGFDKNNGTINIVFKGGTGSYTYIWTKDSQSFTPTSWTALEAGNYTITAIDTSIPTGCSSQPYPFTITQPEKLKVVINGNTILCNGKNTGALSVVQTQGGTVATGYTYEWFKYDGSSFVTTGQTGTSISNGLSAGTYKVIVTDNAVPVNTAESNEFIITQPTAPITVTESKMNVSCNGGTNGTISLTISGGTSGYSILWNNSITTTHVAGQPSRTGLPAGSYFYTITDANGCQYNSLQNIEITEPNKVFINSITQKQPSDATANDGEISISATGGTGTYTYSVTKDNVTTNYSNNTITNLENGTYEVFVKDANNCISSSSIVKLEALTIALINQENIKCFNKKTGSITVMASGGTLANNSFYKYQWYKDSNIINGEISSEIKNLDPGNYFVKVTDDKMLTVTSPVYTITAPTAVLSITSNSTQQKNVSCNSGNDGAIAITVSGGTSGYTYLWNDGSTEKDRTGLAAGTYSVTVTDANACTQQLNGIVISEPSKISLTVPSINNVAIHGQSTGSIIFSADPTGGSGGYTYTWTSETVNSFTANTRDLSGREAGIYKLKVSDNQSCESIQYTFSIDEKPELKVIIKESEFIKCNGDSNGELIAEVTGGLAPYKYIWEKNGVVLSGQNQATISNLGFGDYNVYVTDTANPEPNGPFAQAEQLDYKLIQPDKLKVSLTKQNNVLCYAAATGSIEISIEGGTAPYTQTWTKDGVIYTGNLNQLEKGEYNVVVKDAVDHSCTATFAQAIKIIQPNAPLQVSSVTPVNLTGFETNNGSIAVTVSGGTPNYKYEWRKDAAPSLIGTNSSISGLSIGTYHLIVKDANDCAIPQLDYIITQPDKLEITSLVQTPFTNIKCYGDSIAEFTATVKGGVKEYTFEWLNTTTGIKYTSTEIITTGNTTSKASNLGAGNYIVSVKDASNNILYGQNTFTIAQPDKLAFSYTSQNVSCFGGNNGAIILNITGGTKNAVITEPYNIYVNGKTIPYQNGIVSGLSFGNYTIKITDVNGCQTDQQTIFINQPTNLPYILNPTITPASGFGLATGKITATAAGGTAPYSYQWKSSSNSNIGTDSPTLANVVAGVYTVVVTDAKGCPFSDTFTIQQPSKPVLTETHLQSKCNGLLGSMNAITTGGASFSQIQSDKIYSYKLKNKTTGITTTLTGNTAVFTNIADGSYSIIATDVSGVDSNSIDVEFKQPTPIVVSLVSKVNVNCFGGQDGAIALSVSGGTPLLVNGTPEYKYQWKKKNTATNNYENFTPPALNAFSQGIYAVEVRDGNYDAGNVAYCVGILEDIEITQPDDFKFDILKIVYSDPSAINGNDGKLHFEITGGKSNYDYKFYTKDALGNEIVKTTVLNSSLKTVDFNGLIKDHYFISAKDDTGCIKYADFDFRNNPLTISVSQTQQISCNNANNGILTITTDGGFGSKTISWYHNNVLLDNEINVNLLNVKPGSYYAIIKDLNKVEVTSNTIKVTQPDPVLFSMTQEPVKCIGDSNGKITLTASGGNGNFIYRYSSNGLLIKDWQTFSNGATTTIVDLAEGEYRIEVKDTQQCESNSAISKVTSPTALTISNTITLPATGKGLSNGSIAITVQGANGNYTYQWFKSDNTSINQTTNKAGNLLAGKYYVIITDTKGCNLTSPLLEVTEPLLLETSIAVQNVISCNGDTNGSLKPTSIGGFLNPGDNYTYKWYEAGTNTQLVSTTILDKIDKGSYYVIVRDSNGNEATSTTLIVTEPAILTNTITSDYTLCGDANDWTINATPSGGTSPYIYIWNTGDQTATLKNVPPANYTITVIDSQGCSIVKNITITAPIHLAASEKITIPTCYGGSDATIDITSSGGKAPYTYLWSTGEKSNTLSNAAAGNYSVSITDSKGCIINHDYSIVNPPKDVINLGEDITLCFDQTLTINATIDDDKATYLWKSDKGFSSNKAMITISEPANYTVIVTNKLGCEATDTIQISSQNTAISAEFAISSQVFKNEKIVIVDISNPIADEIEWILPSNATIVNKNKDYAEISFSEIGQYEITLNTKKGNCTAFQTKQIIVTEGEFEENNPDEAETEKKFDLKIYPNPSKGIFTVDVMLDKVMPAHVKVYNLNNNLLIDSKSQEGKDNYLFNFSLSGLPAGLYFVLFESQQGSKLRKIIIQ